jgi:plastocyanin
VRYPRLIGFLAAAVLLLAACNGGSTPAPSSVPPAAGGSGSAGGNSAAVSIQGFAFQTASLTISVGETVTWTNHDSVSHTVTADDGSFTSDPIAPGASYQHTFTTAGSFAYHCSIHPSMKATVVVH